MATIPEHTWDGLLPPYEGRDPTANLNRSPYRCGWREVLERFATSHKRAEILLGLLGYRQILRENGIVDGFQWLTGSFVEQMNREPNDVDVVTFFHAPEGFSPALAKTLLNHGQIKKKFLCDQYPVPLSYHPSSGITPDKHGPVLVDHTAYWYGLFSHRRDTYAWKGFIQIDLYPAEFDEPARQALEAFKQQIEAQQQLEAQQSKLEESKS